MPPVPSWAMDLDKLAHAVLYTILGGTLGYARHYAVPAPPHWLLIGLGSLYGATDEWHQGFVRGRSPDLEDWMVDVIGVTLGYAAVLLVLAWWVRRKRPGGGRIDVSS